MSTGARGNNEYRSRSPPNASPLDRTKAKLSRPIHRILVGGIDGAMVVYSLERSRDTRTIADCFLADRSLPWWATACGSTRRRSTRATWWPTPAAPARWA